MSHSGVRSRIKGPWSVGDLQMRIGARAGSRARFDVIKDVLMPLMNQNNITGRTAQETQWDVQCQSQRKYHMAP